jgi:hypothetical protein
MKSRALCLLVISCSIFLTPLCFAQQALPSQPSSAQPSAGGSSSAQASKSPMEGVNNVLPQ